MLFYCERITPRLQYVADFVSRYFSGSEARLTTDPHTPADGSGGAIWYSSRPAPAAYLQILPENLLFETGIRPQPVRCNRQGDHPVFFATGGDTGFDLLAAIFYLLSRYEEYLPHRTDLYGRYAHENALAFREGFLQVPLVNCWLENLRDQLRKKYAGLRFAPRRFRFLPTYDIDEAFAFRAKPAWRTAGGLVRSLLRGAAGETALRWQVLRGKRPDPYDAFAWMDGLHRQYGLAPYYFFLVPTRRGRYDRNNPPGDPAIRELIRQHAARYAIGLHPSWRSGDDPPQLAQEKARLEQLAGVAVQRSRQHFIRLSLPGTYRRLLEAGIRTDFSMGYGSINGFRASVADPFYWYDLEKDQATELLLEPFCFMDANAYFEQGQDPAQTARELQHYARVVTGVNGTLTMIWHNFMLGNEPRFAGWRDLYGDFIRQICEADRMVQDVSSLSPPPGSL